MDVEVVVAPPSIYLIPVAELVRKEIQVAAQNCYIKLTGAFTGEIRSVPFFYSQNLLTYPANVISPAQLADAGIPYVILGAHLCLPVHPVLKH